MIHEIRYLLQEIMLNYEYEQPTYIVAAIKLPTGAIELITNTTNIKEKISYYLNAYDEEMRLKVNKEVSVVNVMVG